MKEAAEGHFTTEALQWNQDKSPTISGKVNKLQTNPYTFPGNSFCVSNLQFLQVFTGELCNDSILLARYVWNFTLLSININ